jgi:HAD superfamily hydrolase (TIGR01509 family)
LTSAHRVPPEVGALVDVVLTGDRVPRKPDPEAFRAAALALGVPVERCVVVDDAAVNVRGARRAGAVIVAHVDVETTVAELDVLFGPDRP